MKRLLMPSRRECLALAGMGLGTWLLTGCRQSAAPPSTASSDTLMRFPEKVPLRVLNDRPPNLETPWEYYQHDLTPNEAFYVRWHLQMIPTEIDTRTWRLRVAGHVDRALELSLDELRNMPAVSIVAVNQCSGNSRGLFEPRVTGAQWGNGAMGNARWTGVRLADLLARSGIQTGAVEVSFAGLDRGGLNTIPDFVKALPIAIAQGPDILVAYEMNGAPLPMLNGYPVRLVVPGWFATYWVKALSHITVLNVPFTGYWMTRAYRIPAANNGYETPDQQAVQAPTVPISRMRVRSFIVKPANNEEIPLGHPYPVDGIAFDGGDGIRRVEFSSDGGATWQDTTLGTDLGRYSFRRWRIQWQPQQHGEYRLQVRATSNSDQTQPAVAAWNRAGYLRNVVEEIHVRVA